VRSEQYRVGHSVLLLKYPRLIRCSVSGMRPDAWIWLGLLERSSDTPVFCSIAGIIVWKSGSQRQCRSCLDRHQSGIGQVPAIVHFPLFGLSVF